MGRDINKMMFSLTMTLLFSCGHTPHLQILLSFFPGQAVEGYGVGTPNFKTDAEQVILLRVTQECGACCLGFACLMLLPLIRGGEKETIQLALIVSAVSSALSTLYAITIPWPDVSPSGKQQELIFALQNLFLTGLPLAAYLHVPDAGLSGIYKMRELLETGWWLCNKP